MAHLVSPDDDGLEHRPAIGIALVQQPLGIEAVEAGERRPLDAAVAGERL
jgi:hypothetical protein